MRTIAAIFLIILLLCNMMGLPVAVLCLDHEYAIATPKSTGSKIRIIKTYQPSLSGSVRVEANGYEGLYRIQDQLYNVVSCVHQNDTLFVTLQNNEAAWQRFSELAEMMQEVSSGKTASHPFSKAIKMLDDLAKVFLQVSAPEIDFKNESENHHISAPFPDLAYTFLSHVLPLLCPPPETPRCNPHVAEQLS
ncbi:hypothetical protein [Dyadobacter diqingensis]|uniref:hypothetical protein n=1 Tax=Dyadobacter diqingensis TaxID=2938121 RepID=UPI0020C51589|nr:hypothetical protein [Dyadobacter diqingensis]